MVGDTSNHLTMWHAKAWMLTTQVSFKKTSGYAKCGQNYWHAYRSECRNPISMQMLCDALPNHRISGPPVAQRTKQCIWSKDSSNTHQHNKICQTSCHCCTTHYTSYGCPYRCSVGSPAARWWLQVKFPPGGVSLVSTVGTFQKSRSLKTPCRLLVADSVWVILHC